jgi:hypothetical protein
MHTFLKNRHNDLIKNSFNIIIMDNKFVGPNKNKYHADFPKNYKKILRSWGKTNKETEFYIEMSKFIWVTKI